VSAPRLLALCTGVLLAAGCGLDDSATVECRCAEDTDVSAFAHCRDVDVAAEHADATSPFSTRVPDCPSGDLLFLREPTTPEDVLFNVRDTFEGFSPVQYLDHLTEGFLFVPEVAGLDLYRDVYGPPDGYDPDAESDPDTLWTRDDERRFTLNLLDRQRFSAIIVGRWYDSSRDERRTYEDPLRETYIFPYILDLTEQADDAGNVRAFEVRGRMEVDLVTPSEENPVWSIRRWQDFRETVDDQSFTELRGSFAQ
jgi:hypothetical protein